MNIAIQALDVCGRGGVGLHLAEIPMRPRSAAEASAALDMVSARLARQRDPRAAFAEIYAVITRRVAESVDAASGVFLEPAWVSRLAGRFCERYLEVLAASNEARHDCGAWAESCRYLGRGATLPFQEALLGLSAHINYDLAIGIFQNIVELGGHQDARMLARYRHDHDAVNALLCAALPEAFERLIRDHGCPVSAFFDRWARAVTRWWILRVLALWRARVWREVLALLEAPGEDERAARIRRMDRRASWVARVLTAPSAVYLGLHAFFGSSLARA